MERFTTECVTNAHRVSYWNDIISHTFTGLEVSCDDRYPYDAKLSRTAVGELTIATPSSSAARLQHTEDHIRKTNGRCLLLHGQLSGSSAFVQDGREASLDPGDFLIADDAIKYEFTLSGNNSMYVVRIPEHVLGTTRLLAERARGIRLPGDAPETKLLHGYVSTLWSEILARGQIVAAAYVGKILIDLIEMACAPFTSRCNAARPIRALRHDSIREFVNEHLFEPDLTGGRIAMNLGVTLRYVQRLFAERNTTPGAYIACQRLWSAAKLLSDPHQCALSVSEVAYSVGFNDLSHFGRQFKAQFGVSPKLYRHRALGA